MPYSDPKNPTGWVSRLQRYSTKDGPGIRTTAFLQGCTLCCPWCSNPECISPAREILSHRRKCVQCGACIAACPSNAIERRDGSIYLNHENCDACGACIEVCPEEVYSYSSVQMDAEQLSRELLRDRVFFDVSGGGVTFSGGEAALQPAFMHATATRLKAEGLHVALDTAGNVPWQNMELLTSDLNLVLFDIKFCDARTHQQWLGVDNHRILNNLKRISMTGIPIWIRLVIIPDINDSDAELNSRLRLAASTPGVERVDLLPYHQYGMGKYDMLGRPYKLGDLEPPSAERMDEILQLAQSYGVPAHIGG